MLEGRSFWESLQKRKVIRATSFYLAAAWLMLQIVDIIGDIWEFPDWVMKTLFLVLSLGIPVVVVLSWIYDYKTDSEIVGNRGTGFIELFKNKGPVAKIVALSSTLLLLTAIFFSLLHLWPDDDLDPRILKLISTGSSPVNHPYNLSYALHGFGAPSNESPYEYGRFIAETIEILDLTPKIPSQLDFSFKTGDLCPLRKVECHDEIMKNLSGTPSLLKVNSELLERYNLMQENPIFNEVITSAASNVIVPFTNLISAQRLIVRKILYSAVQGELEEAWGILRRETSFHRSLLKSSDHILAKMISLALIDEDIRLRLQLLSLGYQTTFSAEPNSRLSLPEQSIVSAMRYEILGYLDTILYSQNLLESYDIYNEHIDSNQKVRTLIRILPLKRNTTANLIVLPLLEVAKASLLTIKDVEVWIKTQSKIEYKSSMWLTNGAGLIYIKEIDPLLFIPYLRRIHDLDRLLVLAQVAEQLIIGKVTVGSVNGWLLSSPEHMRDPLNEQAAVWEKGKLYFEVKRDSAIRRTEIKLELSVAQ